MLKFMLFAGANVLLLISLDQPTQLLATVVLSVSFATLTYYPFNHFHLPLIHQSFALELFLVTPRKAPLLPSTLPLTPATGQVRLGCHKFNNDWYTLFL